MSTPSKRCSDKLHIIDHKTFKNIQQNQSTDKNGLLRKINNAKFRKKSALTGGSGGTFNLFQFLTETPKEKQKANKQRRRSVVHSLGNRTNQKWRKRGKIREGGKRKKYSRLKKSILHYRQQRRQAQLNMEDKAESLNEAVERLSALTIDSEKLQQEHIMPEQKHKSSTTLHSRRFRNYCDNCTTPLLAEVTEQLLRELDRFQKRAVMQNAIKANAHRRFVVGFREARNFLRIQKVKLIIIATDCEICGGKDGLDTTIANIKTQCQQEDIAYLFPLSRRQLAYTLFKKAPVSCVAVLDFDGAREIFSKLMEALQDARRMYECFVIT